MYAFYQKWYNRGPKGWGRKVFCNFLFIFFRLFQHQRLQKLHWRSFEWQHLRKRHLLLGALPHRRGWRLQKDPEWHWLLLQLFWDWGVHQFLNLWQYHIFSWRVIWHSKWLKTICSFWVPQNWSPQWIRRYKMLARKIVKRFFFSYFF